MPSLSPDEQKNLDDLLSKELAVAPTIGIVGMSGVGKSSTINRLFRTDLAVSHTVACTKEFWEIPLRIKSNSGPAAGKPIDLVVYDAPGLGEDFRRDPDYLSKYMEVLPSCDVVLWLLAARNRALALDQQYLESLKHLSERMVFGLAQVDLVEPMDWKPSLPIPSIDQEHHIKQIVADRSEKISAVLSRDVKITPFSNTKGYNLEALFTEILISCTEQRKWIFQGIKGFNFEDFLPTQVRRLANGRSDGTERTSSAGRVDNATIWPSMSSRNPGSRSIIETVVSSLGHIFSSLRPGADLTQSDLRVIQEAIGRSDIDRNPPSPEETNRIKDHIESIKRRRTSPSP